jgi:ESCRT-II complex subunit VPS22
LRISQSCFRDDLARAIKKLHSLGSGFQIIPVGENRIVQSVPGELNMDHTTVLQLAQVVMEITSFNIFILHQRLA